MGSENEWSEPGQVSSPPTRQQRIDVALAFAIAFALILVMAIFGKPGHTPDWRENPPVDFSAR